MKRPVLWIVAAIVLASGAGLWKLRYRLTPFEPPSLASTITVGDAHVLAIDATGRILGWGTNIHGALGLPDVCVAKAPAILTADPTWRSVHTGTEASYAIATDGTLWRRAFSQRGCASSQQLGSPYESLNWDSHWLKVQESWGIAAGIDDQGALWFWDDKEILPEAARDLGGRAQVTLVKASAAPRWQDFCLGIKKIYAVAADGTLWADTLVLNPFGRAARAAEFVQMAQIPASVRFTRVFCRENAEHVLVLDSQGALWGFGRNMFGELGNGERDEFPNVATVPQSAMQRLTGRRWRNIAVGMGVTLGVADDGSLWRWGNDVVIGRVGDLESGDATKPRLVDRQHRWVSVSAGHLLAAALTADGIVCAWGSAENGTLAAGVAVPLAGGIVTPLGTDSARLSAKRPAPCSRPD